MIGSRIHVRLVTEGQRYGAHPLGPKLVRIEGDRRTYLTKGYAYPNQTSCKKEKEKVGSDEL